MRPWPLGLAAAGDACPSWIPAQPTPAPVNPPPFRLPKHPHRSSLSHVRWLMLSGTKA